MSTYSDNLSEQRLSEMSDTDRLWWSQFGNPIELFLRIPSVLISGTLVWLYDGRLLGLIWMLAYLIPLAICYVTLRPNGNGNSLTEIVGQISHVSLAIAFASLPIYLLASPDPVLMFCAAFAVIILGAFTLMREEPPASVPPLDIAIGWVAIAVVAATHIPDAESLLAQAIMALLCFVLGGYYTLALISVRSVRVELRAASHRAQQIKQAEAVGRLSGGIAHDFNNILSAVQGSLELYREVPVGSEKDALVDEAREASARASLLVSQLLAFARRAPLEPVALPAQNILEEAASLARQMLPTNVEVEIRLPDHPILVLADREGLQTALVNLIRNAAEATGQNGTIVLAADLTQGSASDAGNTLTEEMTGAHVSFSVADDGPGMAPNVADRATEPFFTTKTVGKGSGLGLSMVSGFSQQSGGALQIKSSELGTIVTMHLPLVSSQR